jgi:hypothetical protein
MGCPNDDMIHGIQDISATAGCSKCFAWGGHSCSTRLMVLRPNDNINVQSNSMNDFNLRSPSCRLHQKVSASWPPSTARSPRTVTTRLSCKTVTTVVAMLMKIVNLISPIMVFFPSPSGFYSMPSIPLVLAYDSQAFKADEATIERVWNKPHCDDMTGEALSKNQFPGAKIPWAEIRKRIVPGVWRRKKEELEIRKLELAQKEEIVVREMDLRQKEGKEGEMGKAEPGSAKEASVSASGDSTDQGSSSDDGDADADILELKQLKQQTESLSSGKQLSDEEVYALYHYVTEQEAPAIARAEAELGPDPGGDDALGVDFPKNLDVVFNVMQTLMSEQQADGSIVDVTQDLSKVQDLLANEGEYCIYGVAAALFLYLRFLVEIEKSLHESFLYYSLLDTFVSGSHPSLLDKSGWGVTSMQIDQLKHHLLQMKFERNQENSQKKLFTRKLMEGEGSDKKSNDNVDTTTKSNGNVDTKNAKSNANAKNQDQIPVNAREKREAVEKDFIKELMSAFEKERDEKRSASGEGGDGDKNTNANPNANPKFSTKSFNKKETQRQIRNELQPKPRIYVYSPFFNDSLNNRRMYSDSDSISSGRKTNENSSSTSKSSSLSSTSASSKSSLTFRPPSTSEIITEKADFASGFIPELVSSKTKGAPYLSPFSYANMNGNPFSSSGSSSSAGSSTSDSPEEQLRQLHQIRRDAQFESASSAQFESADPLSAGKVISTYPSMLHNLAKASSFCARGQWGMEVHFHEWLLHSPHRELDPEKADFYFVPGYGICIFEGGFLTLPQIEEVYRRLVGWGDSGAEGDDSAKLPKAGSRQVSLPKLNSLHHILPFLKGNERKHIFTFGSGMGINLLRSWRELIPDSIFLTPETSLYNDFPHISVSPFNTYKDICIPGFMHRTEVSSLVRMAQPILSETLQELVFMAQQGLLGPEGLDFDQPLMEDYILKKFVIGVNPMERIPEMVGEGFGSISTSGGVISSISTDSRRVPVGELDHFQIAASIEEVNMKVLNPTNDRYKQMIMTLGHRHNPEIKDKTDAKLKAAIKQQLQSIKQQLRGRRYLVVFFGRVDPTRGVHPALGGSDVRNDIVRLLEDPKVKSPVSDEAVATRREEVKLKRAKEAESSGGANKSDASGANKSTSDPGSFAVGLCDVESNITGATELEISIGGKNSKNRPVVLKRKRCRGGSNGRVSGDVNNHSKITMSTTNDNDNVTNKPNTINADDDSDHLDVVSRMVSRSQIHNAEEAFVGYTSLTDMHRLMGDSKFCFIPRGKSAWSLRFFEALFATCVSDSRYLNDTGQQDIIT